VQDAAEIEILLAGRSEHFLAKVLARDPRTDIAVLLARLPATIEPLALGDSSRMRVGETVFAIGNPFGLGHTVTAGILSAKDRILGTGRADRYLQTDAAINFGNSGGPLFNAKAEVVGINTLIRADAQGIGFAIPANTVKKWLPALAAKGDLPRAWLGIVVANLSTALRNLYGVADDTATGVIVTNLVKGSPAQKLGLEEGDRLTSLRARSQVVALDNVWALRDAIDALSPGDEVEMEIYRRAKRLSGKVKLGRMPTEDRLPEGHDYY
jgi:serine protease Do